MSDGHVVIERDDCTIAVWEDGGAYRGCISFALDLEDGFGERCEILTGEDNIQTSGNSILVWQKVSLGIQEHLVVYELELLPEMLNSNECRTMDELGATKFEIAQSGFRSLGITRDSNGWFLLFRTNLEVALYESGQLVWRRDLSDDSLSAQFEAGSN